MRIVFEGDAALKYWLTAETHFDALCRKKTGIVALVTDDATTLLGIFAIRSGRSLTPWLRRRNALPFTLREKDKGAKFVELDSFTMRTYILLARSGSRDERPHAIIHRTLERFVVHITLGGRTAARLIPAKALELQILLNRISLRHGPLDITLVGRTLQDVPLMNQIRLKTSWVFETERLDNLESGRFRHARDVLVVTNLHGEKLPHLDNDLPFWSRGPKGCRFRHVYGNMTQKRVESAVSQNSWDLIIYRGHGVVVDGLIAWKLADSTWQLPKDLTAFYLHLSCLADAHLLDLEKLPAKFVLTPLRVLEDFDDTTLVRDLIERIQKSGNLVRSVRQIQQTYPDFIFLAC